MLRFCKWCGRQYNDFNSTSRQQWLYCSKMCEMADKNAQNANKGGNGGSSASGCSTVIALLIVASAVLLSVFKSNEDNEQTKEACYSSAIVSQEHSNS